MNNKSILSFAISSVYLLLSTSAVVAHSDEWQSIIEKGKSSSIKGDYKEAEKQFSLAFELVEPFGSKDIRYSQTLTRLAEAYWAQRSYDQAVDTYQRVIAAQEKYYGDCDPQVALTIKCLVGVYCSKGRHSQAEPLARRMLAIDEKNFGTAHPEIANDLNHLATILCFEHKSAEAEASLLRALEIQKSNDFSVNFSTVDTMRNVAWSYYTQGNFDRARPLYEAVLVYKTKLLGENHPAIVACFRDLAMRHKALNDHQKVVEYCEKANDVVEKQNGLNSLTTVQSLNTLGKAYGDAGEHKKAQETFVRVLKIREKEQGSNSAEFERALSDVVLSYVHDHEYTQVLPYFRRLKRIGISKLEAQLAKAKDPKAKHTKAEDAKAIQNIVIGFNNLGVTCLNCNQKADAERFFTRAVKLDPSYSLAYENRAIVRKQLGDLKGSTADRLMAKKHGFGVSNCELTAKTSH